MHNHLYFIIKRLITICICKSLDGKSLSCKDKGGMLLIGIKMKVPVNRESVIF